MMDFDDLKAAGSGLGTAAVTIFDKSFDMVAGIRRLAHFYTHESCGQCTPCREGTDWMENILERIEKGEADRREIPMLEEISRQVEGIPYAPLGDAAAWPIQGLIKNYTEEMEERCETTFDPKRAHQPAWTGGDFVNKGWVDVHGEGSTYVSPSM